MRASTARNLSLGNPTVIAMRRTNALIVLPSLKTAFAIGPSTSLQLL
jgi:hypothetical protein